MLKYTVLFIGVFCLVNSQRPWHAGSSNRLPEVLPQYLNEGTTTEQAGQVAQRIDGLPGQAIQPDLVIYPGLDFQPSMQPGQTVLSTNMGAQPGYALQPGYAIQPSIASQPGQTVLPTIIGVQPGYAFQPGYAIQPSMTGQPGQTVLPTNIGVQPGYVFQYGQAMYPMPGVQGPQGVTATTANPNDPLTISELLNRIDESNGVNTVITAQPTTPANRISGSPALTTTTINPADLPVDAHGDIDLINRIKTWPRDKQPFWYVNWQAIQAHRGDANNPAQVPQLPNPSTRPFFAGTRGGQM